MNAQELATLVSRLKSETKVAFAVAETSEGYFTFDVRDEGVGWRLALGQWEPLESTLIKRLIVAGDLVVDAGANLGWFTTIAARLVGPQGRVVAFEPDPRNCSLLRGNIGQNQVSDRVTVVEAALFEHDGEITLETSRSNFGDHRIRPNGSGGGTELYEENVRETQPVPARSLDSVLAEHDLAARPIRVLKIDTQGAEVSIFRGARRALERTAYAIAEFWPYGIGRAGYEVAEYEALIAANFASFARLDSFTIDMRPIAEFKDDIRRPPDKSAHSPAGFSNYFFAK